MTLCLHCGRRSASRPRNLCHVCYTDRNVRGRYAAIGPQGNHWDADISEADLDRMIAEQRPTMPSRRVGED